MSERSIVLPESIKDEIKRQASEPAVPPRILTREDRIDFIDAVPCEFRSEAEVEWNRVVDDNERQREEWLSRVVTILAPLLNGDRSATMLATAGRGTLRSPQSEMLNTNEAAGYLRHSVSWLLRQPDISYIKGTPNLYRRVDLDDWLKRHTLKPRGI